MAKTPRNPVTESTPVMAPAKVKPPRVGVLGDEAPQEAMTFIRVKGGYVVVLLTIDEWHVVDAEVLTDGVVPRHHAEDVWRTESVKRFLHPGLGS